VKKILIVMTKTCAQMTRAITMNVQTLQTQIRASPMTIHAQMMFAAKETARIKTTTPTNAPMEIHAQMTSAMTENVQAHQ
jgi:hypothetical protein